MELRVPPRLEGLFRELRVFERSREAFEARAFTMVDYIEKSTHRTTAGMVMGFLKPVSRSSLWCWMRRFRSRIRLAEGRRLMAVEETVPKSMGERLWIWAAMDPEADEVIRLEAS